MHSWRSRLRVIVSVSERSIEKPCHPHAKPLPFSQDAPDDSASLPATGPAEMLTAWLR